MCVCVYMCVYALVSTPHSVTDVGSVLKLAVAYNGTLFPVIAENIKVSLMWSVSVMLSIGGVWCLSIAIGLVNKKEHAMACVDTCGCIMCA